MGREFKDRVNDRHGRLTVKADTRMRHPSTGERLWLCWCSCGGGIVTTHSALKKDTKSCGCIRKENVHRNLPQFRFERFVSASKPSQRTPVQVFGSKGPVNRAVPRRTARKAYAAFDHRLTDQEINQIQVAICHAELGEGRVEFDRVWAPIARRLEEINLEGENSP